MVTNRDLPNNANELLEIYQTIGEILRQTKDDRFVEIVENWESVFPKMRSYLAEGLDAREKRRVISGLKQGLRDLRELLPSISRSKGEALYREIEPLLYSRPQ